MALFRRSEPTASAVPIEPFVGVYGKLPNFGDFINIRANLEPAASFQIWLTSAVEWAERRQLPGWPTAFESAPLAFVYRPRSLRGGALVGIVRGSRDAVGRRFPFAIFASVANDALSVNPHVLPLIAESFLEAATRMVDAAARCSSTSEIESLLQSLPLVGFPRQGEAQYEEWARSTRAHDVWRDFYNSADGVGPRFAVHTIFEALAPFGNEETPKTQLGVRVPIGAASSLAVAFWVDVVRRAGRLRREVPSFCWSPWWAPGPPVALVSLGEAHPSCLAEAALGVGDTDVVCDLTSPAPDTQATRCYAPLPQALDEDLRSQQARVCDLLDAFARPAGS